MAERTILIVEDDPVARQTLQKTLRTAGFRIAVASDAHAAVSQARATQPDLIILDLGLPAGGGFAVMDRLRVLPALSTTPILVVSGQDRTNEAKAVAAGANAYLQKPATPEQVLDAIRRILD